MTTDNGPPRHVLSRGQAYRLWKWLEDYKDWLAENRPALKVAAQKATEELGFTVNKSHLTTMFKDGAPRWDYPNRPGTGDGKKVTAKQLVLVLTARVKSLEERCRLLEDHLACVVVQHLQQEQSP